MDRPVLQKMLQVMDRPVLQKILLVMDSPVHRSKSCHPQNNLHKEDLLLNDLHKGDRNLPDWEGPN
jgi:hypothetical protein